MKEKRTKEPAQSKWRGLLRKAFWTVAGMVGVASLLRAQAAPAQANGSEGPTTFTATGGATAVFGQSDSGVGVFGFSDSTVGVVANSHSGWGLSAASGTGVGAILACPGGVAVQINGHIQILGDSIGQAILRGGTASVVVNAPAATPKSLILLTPLDICYGVLSISKRETGSFTISSAAVVPLHDTTIAYLIVN